MSPFEFLHSTSHPSKHKFPKRQLPPFFECLAPPEVTPRLGYRKNVLRICSCLRKLRRAWKAQGKDHAGCAPQARNGRRLSNPSSYDDFSKWWPHLPGDKKVTQTHRHLPSSSGRGGPGQPCANTFLLVCNSKPSSAFFQAGSKRSGDCLELLKT